MAPFFTRSVVAVFAVSLSFVLVDRPALAQQGEKKTSIPLPEHPRPDWQRELWQNLNGHWRFQFDPDGTGESQGWHKGELPGDLQILVPFPWGSALSGVEDRAEIGWYSRAVR